MEFHLCDERGPHGFSWVADEAMSRTSHALAAEGRVWLVDAVDWPEAVARARELGEPAGVLQLLDRHGRDCATLAARLGVPHLVAPEALPGTPFTVVPVVRRRRWQEIALHWAATRTLVVADAFGSNAFYTGGRSALGVHLLLRLFPPRQLGRLELDHLLVGHGEGLHGAAVAPAVQEALRTARRGLPGVLLRLPFAGRR